MNILEFVKNFDVPVMVLDEQKTVVYQNSAFNSLFGTNSTKQKFQKFKNAFSIQSCMLYPENITDYNPIDLAIDSNENFKTFAIYQKTADVYLNIYINAYKIENFYIYEFIDYTDKTKFEELDKEYQSIKSELLTLKKENAQSTKTRDKAQVQAIKMALLNRIFESLRQSINLNITLNLAFKELSEIFGLSKVLFAFYDEEKFIIKNIYPKKYDNEIEQTFVVDEGTLKTLENNKFAISNVATTLTDKKILAKPECRLLCPIYHTNKLLGVISGFFPHKNLDKINADMLSAISAQFTSAIVQAYLFQELNSKNEQLQKAYTKLEQTQLQLINSEKMASLGQLVAGVAHEINTPLASINSNNSLLEKLLNSKNFDEELIQMAKSMIETDKEAIKRISNIVKSLKRFVRLDEAELQQANINKELDLTLELLKHETKNRIEIIKNYTEVDEIKCYPNLLNQVFMNILMNAIQSIDGQGSIFISTKIDNNNMIISIKDTGSGMNDATKAKIFKTGFTTKKVGIGTGLGLMICKDIIDKHSGKITFNSQKDVGTEFVISIPIIK